MVEVLNKKDSMGHTYLLDVLNEIKPVKDVLQSLNIEHAFTGGSALDIEIPVPESYLKDRITSRLIDLDILPPNSNVHINSIFKGLGWKELNAEDYFSITYISGGNTYKVPTITNELLFIKDDVSNGPFYLAVVVMPSLFYRANGGRIYASYLKQPPKKWEILAYKIFRSQGNDISDVANAALVNDFSPMLQDEEAMSLLKEMAKSKSQKLKDTTLSIIHKIRSIQQVPGDLAIQNIYILEKIAGLDNKNLLRK
ncbi:MAG: hypothetical protein ACP5RP_01205 [Candidatus Micrarchaeia archaeon]